MESVGNFFLFIFYPTKGNLKNCCPLSDNGDAFILVAVLESEIINLK
jgi:hypothetical protein